MLKTNTENFINKSKQVHGDKYDYSKVEYVNNSTKVCIICPEHGEFWQTPNSHLSGNGCPKCYGNKKLTTEEYVSECKKIHNNKYSYDKTIYVNKRSKIIITCPIHGDFIQTAGKHKTSEKATGFTPQKNAITMEPAKRAMPSPSKNDAKA